MFKPTLKIGGFGFSKSAVLDSMAKTTVGMRGYMAPEVSDNPHADGVLGPQVKGPHAVCICNQAWMQADPMCSEYNNKQIRQQSLEPRCWPWPRHQNPSIPSRLCALSCWANSSQQ